MNCITQRNLIAKSSNPLSLLGALRPVSRVVRLSVLGSVLLTSLTGCSGLLDSSSTFGCTKEHPINCQDTMQAYEASIRDPHAYPLHDKQGKAHFLSKGETISKDQAQATSLTYGTAHKVDVGTSVSEVTNSHPTRLPVEHTGPVRVPEVTAQLTIFPWTDADGALHDLERMYLLVTPAHWGNAPLAHKMPKHKVVEPLDQAANPMSVKRQAHRMSTQDAQEAARDAFNRESSRRLQANSATVNPLNTGSMRRDRQGV